MFSSNLIAIVGLPRLGPMIVGPLFFPMLSIFLLLIKWKFVPLGTNHTLDPGKGDRMT